MNFCVSFLNCRISCDKPAVDGYEVHHLLTRNGKFLTEGYIRPPIDVVIDLPLPIHLSHIIIGTAVGNVRSVGFSVYARMNGFSSSQASQFPRPQSNYHHNDIASTSSNDSNIYYCLASFSTNGEKRVLLRNHFYQHHSILPMPPIDRDDGDVFHCALKHPKRDAMNRIESLTLRITRNATNGACGLNFLEVWGQPSLWAGVGQKRDLWRQWLNYSGAVDDDIVLPRMYGTEAEPVIGDGPSIQRVEDSEFDIPEDFLDPLTCEVMSIPILLPSGQSLDASTLERFSANEGIWGRPASDPFTGVPFNERLKPLPNAPLKARIDRFLLLHEHQPLVQACGRTVGGVSYCHGTNTPASNKEKSLKVANEQISNNQITKANMKAASCAEQCKLPLEPGNHSDSTDESEFTCVKRQKYDDAVQSFSRSQLKSQFNASSQVKSEMIGDSVCDVKSSSSHPNLHHSVIHMIGGALASIQPRSTVRTKSNRIASQSIQNETRTPFSLELLTTRGQSCQCGQSQTLYSVPCGHKICKSCLSLGMMSDSTASHKTASTATVNVMATTADRVQCSQCGEWASKRDIMKWHPKGYFE